MPAPKEMKVTMVFDDGTQKEVTYTLDPLRNGDNPHQAGYVGEPGGSYEEVIEGRGMGFTNHIDLLGYSVAVELSKTMALLKDARTETVVINKHTNPAVFAARTDQLEALQAALATDKKSPSGGILCCSGKLTKATADFLVKKNREERFVLDVLAAPGFETGCTDELAQVMKNLRIVDVTPLDTWEKINAGLFGLNMKWTIGGKPIITAVDSDLVLQRQVRHGCGVQAPADPRGARRRARGLDRVQGHPVQLVHVCQECCSSWLSAGDRPIVRIPPSSPMSGPRSSVSRSPVRPRRPTRSSGVATTSTCCTAWVSRCWSSRPASC